MNSIFTRKSFNFFILPQKLFSSGFNLILFHLAFLLNTKCSSVMGTECMTRKYYAAVSYLEIIHINRTIKCDMYFQWTVADFCCYDKYDRYDKNPFCCYSETYKLVLAVTFICLVLFIGTFTIFFCWVYNLPHHLLYILSCGRFHLSSWLLRNKNGPYVDPSFYAGEPFWARGAEIQPYPLRPMPPKIFYPAPPPKLKYRWDVNNCDIPLFIIASRQFTRNPYSARPQDRNNHHNSSAVAQITSGVHPPGGGAGTSSESRRNSLSSNYGGVPGGGGGTSSSIDYGSYPHQQTNRDSSSASNSIFRRGSSALLQGGNRGQSGGRRSQNPPFKVNLDEGEATAELIEALKVLDEGMEASLSESGLNTSQTSLSREQPILTTATKRVRNFDDEEEEDENDFDIRTVRPNTTGGSGLDQYGNYVSQQQPHMPKPNLAMLNQQLTNLRLPVYNMPGVHSAIATVQNYHVVSSNLGNPMETILEDDSLEEEYLDMAVANKNPKKNSTSINEKDLNIKEDKSSFEKPQKSSQHDGRPPLKRRATSIASSVETGRSSPRVLSAMDHVVVTTQTPTTRAVVPFTPTLPGSLSESDDKNEKQRKGELRRNSVI